MGICLTACGKDSNQQTNKIQHYVIYCEAHYGSYAKNEYSNCGCKNYSDMKTI